MKTTSEIRKVKVAIIGSGWWGTTAHIPAVIEHPAAQLVGIQHQEEAQLEAIRRHLASHQTLDQTTTTHSTDVEKILSIPGLEMVVISSIPVAHYEQAKRALERGLHVVIEKPMTMNLKQAAELIELAEKHKRHFILSAPWNYTAHTAALSQHLLRQDFGSLKEIKIEMSNYTLGLYQGKDWKTVNRELNDLLGTPVVTPSQTSYSDPKLAGGGQLYCQTSHVLAYISKLFNPGSTLQVKPIVTNFSSKTHEGSFVDVYNEITLKLDQQDQNALKLDPDFEIKISTHGAAHPDREDPLFKVKGRVFKVSGRGTSGSFEQELWKGSLDVSMHGKRTEYPVLENGYPFMAPTRNLIEILSPSSETVRNVSPAIHGLFAMQCTEQCLALKANADWVKKPNI